LKTDVLLLADDLKIFRLEDFINDLESS
jgi:hypothetical protein